MNLKEVEVKPISNRIAARVIEQYHYLGSCSPFASLSFGFFHLQESLGVCVYGRPVARLEDQEHTFELWRFVLLPDKHEPNLASYCLGQTHKYIWKHFPEVKRIIAYASTGQKHEGIIYQATNYTLTKRTKGNTHSSARQLNDTSDKLKYEFYFPERPRKTEVKKQAILSCENLSIIQQPCERCKNTEAVLINESPLVYQCCRCGFMNQEPIEIIPETPQSPTVINPEELFTWEGDRAVFNF